MSRFGQWAPATDPRPAGSALPGRGGWEGLVLLLLLLAQALCPAPAEATQRVLLIGSYDKDLPSQRQLEEGLEEGLAEALATGNGTAPQLHFEYLDAGRVDWRWQRPAMTQYLQARYGPLRIDQLVATHTQAAEYVAAEPGLLPQARRVFADVPQEVLPLIRAHEPQASVIAVQSNYPAALQEVLRLAHPRRLVVIGETRDDAGRGRAASFERAAAQVLPPGVSVDYWLDRRVADLEQQVATLAPGTVLYYLLQFSDGAGRQMTPYEVARRVSAAASVPMFSQWETLVGSGIVGGYGTSHRLIGRQLGRALLADPGAALAMGGDGQRHAYDWRALRRWGLDGAALPAASLVLHREPSLLQQHRVALLATALVLAGLMLLLGLLLAAQRARQRMVVELTRERGLLAERVAERTAELAQRVAELARRNEDLTRVKTQLALLANTDGLTGLANRRHFDDVLAQELRRLHRGGGELSLLMIDVDHFKAFNDRYGHPEGDRCLQALAGVLAHLCRRPADLAARFGGEEFVLVLPDTPLSGAQARALQLQHALVGMDWPHAASPVAPRVTVSVGVLCVRAEDGLGAAALLAQVDEQLYRAKGEGRNRIVAGMARLSPAGPGLALAVK